MAWNGIAILALAWFAVIALSTVWSAKRYGAKKIYLALFAAALSTNICRCAMLVLDRTNASPLPTEMRADASIFQVMGVFSLAATLILYLNILLYRYMRIFMIVKKSRAHTVLTGVRIVVCLFFALYVVVSMLDKYHRYTFLQQVSPRTNDSFTLEEQREFKRWTVLHVVMALISCVLVIAIEIGITLQMVSMVKKARSRQPIADIAQPETPQAHSNTTSTHPLADFKIDISSSSPFMMKFYLYMGLIACSDILVAIGYVFGYSDQKDILYSLTLIAASGVSIHVILYCKFLDLLVLTTRKTPKKSAVKTRVELNIVKPNSTEGSDKDDPITTIDEM